MICEEMNVFSAYLVFLTTYTANANLHYVDPEMNISSSANHSLNKIIEKLKCIYYTGNTVNENDAGIENTIPTNTGNTTQIYSNLRCSNNQLVYRYIGKDEFIHAVKRTGELPLHSLSKTFGPDTYCIKNVIQAQNTLSSNTSSNANLQNRQKDPEIIVKIAACIILEQDKKHHQDVHENRTTFTKSSIPSLKKCCPIGTILTKSSKSVKDKFKCVAAPNATGKVKTQKYTGNDLISCHEWQPAVFTTQYKKFSEHNHLTEMYSNLNITYGFPHCTGLPHSLVNSKDIWFKTLGKGTVMIGLTYWFEPVWLPPENNEYCLDEVFDIDNISHSNLKINSHAIYHRNQILLYCSIDHFQEYLLQRRVLGWMCILSAGVMFILIIIYASVWELQNLSGWTQFNIFLAIFLVNFTEGIRQLTTLNTFILESTTSCVIEAAIAQYFYVSLSTSAIVMSFDLFYMFWNLQQNTNGISWNKYRLIGYLLFSWFLPLCIVGVSFYFAHLKGVKDAETLEGVYALAQERCCSPIRGLGFQVQGIMFIINIIFFFFTTFLIWKHKRGLRKARKLSKNMKSTWRSVSLVLKLVIVMGVASLSIPIDYFFFSKAPLSTTAICFRMLHFMPFFPGLFIFGFNEKNATLINKKYPKFGKYFGKIACKSKRAAYGTPDLSRTPANTVN